MSDYLGKTLAVSIPCIGGLAGGYIARKNTPWLKSLILPSWTPPDSAFAPAFAGIYVSMGAASYMVVSAGGGLDGDAASPMAWYAGQLALNWAWAPLLFGLKSPKLAFINSVCLWGAVAGTIWMFQDLSGAAAGLMLPALGWVSFASVLNYRIWKDNPAPAIKEPEKEE